MFNEVLIWQKKIKTSDELRGRLEAERVLEEARAERERKRKVCLFLLNLNHFANVWFFFFVRRKLKIKKLKQPLRKPKQNKQCAMNVYWLNENWKFKSPIEKYFGCLFWKKFVNFFFFVFLNRVIKNWKNVLAML